MDDRDERRGYESPRVVQLSTRSEAGGVCIDNGSGDQDACDVGIAATNCEADGNAATIRCDGFGNDAII